MKTLFRNRPLIFAIVVFALPLSAAARVSKYWSIAELSEKADAIVVAAFVQTRETGEETKLAESIQPPVPVMGLESEFKVLAVFKGKLGAETFLLHHFKLLPNSPLILNGPGLISFKKRLGLDNRYLLFLKASSAGKFEPLSGQVDPSHSVFHLSHGG